MDFLKTLFSTKGLLIVAYILIGVFVNTASSPSADTGVRRSSAAQLDPVLHLIFWPLSFWHPSFSVGQWPAGPTEQRCS